MRVSEDLLRDLSLLSQNDRTILSIYIGLNRKKEDIEKWAEGEFQRIKPTIADAEIEYLEASLEFFFDFIDGVWEDRPQGIAFFADLGSDYVKGVRLMAPPEENLFILDNEAHIRLLALELDEYEQVGVIMLDASGARILSAAGATIDQLDDYKAKIHHLSKVGGWSQMRYQRRRHKEIVHFVKEIAVDAEKTFSELGIKRIILAGRERLIAELEEYLSKSMRDKVKSKIAWDLEDSNDEFLEKIQPEMERFEREQEEQCLSILESEIKKGGLVSIGIADTRKALKNGQVDTLFLKMGIDKVLAEELTSIAESISAHVEFVHESHKALDYYNGVAALLRYKIR